jgi:hypothetical protein
MAPATGSENCGCPPQAAGTRPPWNGRVDELQGLYRLGTADTGRMDIAGLWMQDRGSCKHGVEMLAVVQPPDTPRLQGRRTQFPHPISTFSLIRAFMI